MANPICTIDRLPEAERSKVLDAILAGEKLSSLAVRLGISRQAVSSYKNRIVAPAIRTANELADHRRRTREASPQSPMEVVDIKASAIQQATESKVLTRQVVKASPVTERLESVWSRTVQKMDEMTTDNGAPWVNAATKQIELMAKLTGELREKSDINVSISIVSPAPQQARVDYGSDDDGCIDIGLE